MKALFLNVQSPPPPRAGQLAAALAGEENDFMVLSELSSGKGSSELVKQISAAGYSVHWIKPDGREYSVALAIRAEIPQRPLRWSAEYGTARAQFALVRVDGVEHCIGGVYAPSLNPGNLAKRSRFFHSMEGLLSHAVRSGRPLLFGGDINEIPPWHSPLIQYYADEGFPFHRRLPELGLVDLARKYLPTRTYSWFDYRGAGQLLDGAFVSAAHENLVTEYRIDPSFLSSGLTDHCGLRLVYT